MSGFFGKLIENRARGPLMAVWMTEGEGAGKKALFVWNGKTWETVCREEGFAEEIAAAAEKSRPGETGMLEAGPNRAFREPFFTERKLVVCGGGHVAQCVIRLGRMLGFHVTVIEDREEYAALAKAAGADRVLCAPFAEGLADVPGGHGHAFVVMTREHVHDVDCLRLILPKDYAYAGMMGSRNRCGNVRSQLIAEGYDEEKVNGLAMPIGLAIGARTPEEIAVSVMAQIVQVMNEQNAGEAAVPGMAEELAACEREGRPAGVLAMIIEKEGEAPRRPGTKMLVRADGTFLGTVGGGLAEARMLARAREMLEEGCREPRLAEIEMMKGTMQCGGRLRVLLLPL